MRVPAAGGSLAQAREFLRRQLSILGVDGPGEDAVLAVNEAVANAVRHAYPAGSGDVEVTVGPIGDGVSVLVRDDGRGPGPWYDTRGAGLGTTIMDRCAITLTVSRRIEGGTEVAFTFQR